MNRARLAAALGAFALVSAAVLVPAVPAAAATFEVDSLTDDGVGYTLREAIADAELSNDPDDRITFAPSLANGTLQLDSVLIITESLVIEGLGSGSLSIAATGPTDYFAFLPSAPGQNFTLSGLRIQGNGINTGMGVFSADFNGFGAGEITISDVSAVDLTTSVSGAAIGVYSAGSVSITDSEFVGNQSTGDMGGAVFVEDSGTVTVSNSEFSGNYADDDGGALSVIGVQSLLVEGSTFGGEGPSDGNGTDQDGGAVSAKQVDTSVDVIDSTFIGNWAEETGGGLYTFETTTVSVRGSTFVGNEAEDGAGAALRVTDGEAQVFESVFTDNVAIGGPFDHGGGLFAEETPNLRVFFSTFTGNDAGGGLGGGVGVEWTANVEVFGSTFEDNSATAGGGLGFGIEVKSVVVDSSTFVANTSEFGQSISSESVMGLLRVVNSTLVEPPTFIDPPFAIAVEEVIPGAAVELLHSTIEGPGGLFADMQFGSALIANTILDSHDIEAVEILSGNDVEAEYSLFSAPFGGPIVDNGGNTFGVTNFGLEALADNGGPTQTRLLTASSPARNAGDPAFGGTPPFDQRGPGFPRVIQDRLDIGAIEMPPVLPNTGSTGLPVWVPIVGGVVVLAGIAFVVFSVLGRRRSAATVEGPAESGDPAEPPTP